MKALLISSLLIASGAAMAEQSLLEGVAKQAANNTAAAVAPGVVAGAETADQALKDAKQVKDAVQNTPEAAKDQTQKAIEGTAKQATPEQVKEGAEAVKSSSETSKKLQGEVKALPKSSKQTAKSLKHKSTAKAQQKGTEKALELLK